MFILGSCFNNKDTFPDLKFTFESEDREIFVHKVVLGYVQKRNGSQIKKEIIQMNSFSNVLFATNSRQRL